MTTMNTSCVTSSAGPASRHVQREPVDLPVPASKQKPEGLSIAFCGPREQILVGVPIGFRILILIAR